MSNQYVNKNRPIFEAQAAAGWAGAAVAAGLLGALTPLPVLPSVAVMAGAGIAGAWRAQQAYDLWQHQRRLDPRGKWEMSYAELGPVFDQATSENAVWMGHGFEWDQRHTQEVFEIIKRDRGHLKTNEKQIGAAWIHGVGEEEKIIQAPFATLSGHVLLVGTTRCGKSRAMELMILQAVRRGEAVIIIDPKGDRDLRDSARLACELAGEPHRFIQFHPAFPETSARINPLRNFAQGTELASRLAVLMGNTGDPFFQQFAQKAVNNVVQGMLICKVRPTLLKIRAHLERGVAPLVVDAITQHCNEFMPPDWSRHAAKYVSSAMTDPMKKAPKLCQYYWEKVSQVAPNQDLEGLISLQQHDSQHLGKIISGVMPIFDMLTSGYLGALLSPTHTDYDDPRPVTDTAQIIRNRQVAYIGLNSMGNVMVGSAVGSALMADLTSAAASIYNSEDGEKPTVNIFVDEAAEVINDQFIQLLNKSGGAGFRLVVATQTFADFEVGAGSEAHSSKILGNLNNKIILRTIDTKTQERIVKEMPEVRVQSLQMRHGSNADEFLLDAKGSTGETVAEEKSPLIPPALLGHLPNGEYIAILSGGRICKGRLPLLKNEPRQ